MKTKEYKVTFKGFSGKMEQFHYAVNEQHARHCFYAKNPHLIGLDHILDISETGAIPSFQFKDK